MNRYTISVPVLLATLVGAPLLGVGVYAAHKFQLNRLSGHLLTLATAEEDRSSWQKAAEHLDRYLRIRPDDSESKVRLALDYSKFAEGLDGRGQNIESQHRSRAIVLCYRAIATGLNLESQELRLALASHLLEAGRYFEAESECKTVLKALPEHPLALRTLGMALAAQWTSGAIEQSKLVDLHILDTIEAARRLNPEDVSLAVTVASLYHDHPKVIVSDLPGCTEVERRQKAQACLDELVEHSPNSAQAYLARSRYRLSHSINGFEDDLQTALKLAPQDPEVVYAAAVFELQQARQLKSLEKGDETVLKRFEKARDHFEMLVANDKFRHVAEAHLGLGDALNGAGEIDQALAAWKAGLSTTRLPAAQVALHSKIADLLIDNGRAMEAAQSLSAVDATLAELDSSTLPGELRSAMIQAQDLRRGTWHLILNQPMLAIGHFQRVVDRPATNANGKLAIAYGWTQLGAAFAALGEWDRSALAFDQAVSLQPSEHRMRIAAARSWLQANRPDLAVERAETALTIQPTFEALFTLASAELAKQQQLPFTDRSWSRTETLVASLEEASKSNAQAANTWQVNLLELQYLLSAKRSEANFAEQVNASLDRAIKQCPTAADYWAQAVPLLGQAGLVEDANRIVDRLLAKDLGAIPFAIIKSRLAVVSKNYPAAQSVLQACLPASPGLDRQRVLQEAVHVARAASDAKQLRSLLELQLSDQPKDLNVLRNLAELDLNVKDYVALKAREAQLAELGPTGVFWSRYISALRILNTVSSGDDPSLNGAIEIQAALAAARPNWPPVYSLRGMIEQRRNHLNEAADAFEQAVQLGSSETYTFEQLILVLDRLNRSTDVEKYLSRYQASKPLPSSLSEIASIHQLQRNPTEAIQAAREAVAKNPHNLQSVLWLGRLLLISSHNPEARKDAEQQFKRAVELAPNDLRSWSGLFSFYYRINDKDGARHTLEEISKHAGFAENEREFVIAQGHELLGNIEEALEHYEVAAKNAPDNAIIQVRLASVLIQRDPSRAKMHLRRAITLDPALRQAKRMLAVVLSASGTDADVQEAETLLTQEKASGAIIATEDNRLRALLLAQQGSAESINRAVQILEQVVGKDGAVDGDRVVLAQLYEHQASRIGDRNTSKARLKLAQDQWFKLAARSAPQPTHLVAISEFFLRQQQVSESEFWTNKLDSQLETSNSRDFQLISQLASLQIRLKQFERCEKWLQAIDESDGNDLLSLRLRAKSSDAQERPADLDTLLQTKAEQLFEASTTTDEKKRCARELGDICSSVNRHSDAERWYRELAKIDSDRTVLVITAIARQGRIDEAIKLCIENHKLNSTRYATLAASLLSENVTSETAAKAAEPMIAAALKQHGQDVPLIYAAAMQHLVHKRYEQATTLFREIIKINPRHVAAMNNLAVILAEKPENRPEALSLIDNAINVVGEHPGLLDTKGAILVYEGQSETAIPLLEIATQGIGVDPRHRFHLAAAYLDVGKPQEAGAEFRQAMESKLESSVLTQIDQQLLMQVKESLVKTPDQNP